MSTTDVQMHEHTLLHARIKLPDSVLEAYENQARASGRSLEEFLSIKLADTVNQTSVGPIYVNDDQRKKLERILKTNFRSAEALVGAVERLSRVKVGQTQVPLDATLNERLRSRCPRQEPFDRWLENQ